MSHLIFKTKNSFSKMLKNSIFLSLFLLISMTSHAQCVSGNCNNGYGVALFPEKGKARYNGNFLNKKPHGFGKAEYGDGSVYEGEWYNGKWQGQGTMTLASGTQLIGIWQDSRFMGSDRVFAADQKPIVRPNAATLPSTTTATPMPANTPATSTTVPNATPATTITTTSGTDSKACSPYFDAFYTIKTSGAFDFRDPSVWEAKTASLGDVSRCGGV
jgi:MORN repeat